MVATRDQSGRLFALDLVETDGALGPQHQVLPGDLRQFLQLRRRQPLRLRWLHRRCPEIRLAGIVAGVPEEADVDEEDRAHAGAWQEESQEDGENHAVAVSRGAGVATD